MLRSKEKIYQDVRSRLQSNEDLLWAQRGDAKTILLYMPLSLIILAGLSYLGLQFHIIRTEKVIGGIVLFSGLTLFFVINLLRTTYALTNRRFLVMNGSKITSYAPENIVGIRLCNVDKNGKGDIILNFNMGEKEMPVGFYGVQNVRHVEDTAVQALKLNRLEEMPQKRIGG